MKHCILFFCTLFVLNKTEAQLVKMIYDGTKVGYNLYSDNNNLIRSINPQYEEIKFYSELNIAGISLGKSYISSKYWVDTEYVEVPIDPNDLSKIKTDTIVNDTKKVEPAKYALAKINGKWIMISLAGIKHLDGPCEEITEINASAVYTDNPENLPFLLAYNKFSFKIFNQNGQNMLQNIEIPNYLNSRLGSKRKAALEISFFGDYLLLIEGGNLVDSIVKVPPKIKIANGKSLIEAPGYEYELIAFKGGTLNVLNLKTGQKMYPVGSNNLEIHFFDDKGNDLFESLNVRDYNSIAKFQQNMFLKIHPAAIGFIQKN